jgi:probable HAF family extracellular repeat protein
VVLLTYTAVPAGADTRFAITDLGLLPGTIASEAIAINNAGKIAGHSYRLPGPAAGDFQGGFRPSVWISGVLEALPMPIGAYDVMATGINDRGDVVGASGSNGPFGSAGLLWQNGTLRRLNDLPGGTSLLGATGINAHGDIVGTSAANSFRFGTLIRGATSLPLPDLPTEEYSFANAINDAGIIVGYAGNAGAAVVWINLAPSQLSHGTFGIGSGAEAINNRGDVGGAILLSGGQYLQAAIWQSGTPWLIDLPSGFLSSRTLGINDSRQVVGYFRASTETFRLANLLPGDRAFLWENGTVHDLNTLIPATSGWTLLRATDVNDLGQIVGTGTAPTGEFRGFLLTPIPEPRTYMLILSGIIVVLRSTSKRTRCRGA